MYNSKMRNIEIPENLFSNLGEIKSKRLAQKEELPKEINDYQENSDIKLTNYTKHGEYRNRITKMYEDIKDIKPVDNEIDNILYFNNYIERGIVVKPKVSSLKQFWTEYRLIKNEKNIRQDLPFKSINYQETARTLDNFDKLFEALSTRVDEINKYIDELKEMRNNIDETTIQLNEDKEQLRAEKKEFLNYKKQEETKIQEEKENLKINFERLQTIIDDLDKKLESVDKMED